MRQLMMMGLMGSLAAGCSRVEVPELVTFDSTGVSLAQIRTENGRITYDGSAVIEEFAVNVRRWGTGSTRSRADTHLEQVDFTAAVVVDTLAIRGGSARRAGVNFNVVGPGVINTDLHTLDGRVELFNVEGFHQVQGDVLYGREIYGEGDFIANGGSVDLQVTPYFDGALVYVESNGGDVQIGLPYGYDYDLTIEADLDYEIAVEELGFDTLIMEPGLAIGRRGFRDIRVDIITYNANVFVHSLN